MQIESKTRPPTRAFPTLPDQDAGRFARLLALTPAAAERDSEPSEAPPSAAGREERRETEKVLPSSEQPRAGTVEAPREATFEPRIEASTPSAAPPRAAPLPAGLAERMLQQVHVHQLPDGSQALRLRVCTGRFVDLDVDLRLERGRVRAAFGTAEGHAYRLLRGSLGTLEEALARRGVAAHPVRLELRRPVGRVDRVAAATPASRPSRVPRRGGASGGGGRLL